MMRSSSFWLVVWLVVALALPAGCGKEPGGPAPSPKRPAAVPVQELPALGHYLPPLDGDRIEFAPPEGWDVPPASSSYIVRARKSVRKTYPTIIVTAGDFEGIADVSAENVKEFAGQIAAAVKKDKSEITPMDFGESAWVAYRKRAKVRKPVTRILDVLYLETVVVGRKYRLELRCEEGMLEKSQPYLFAVAKGIKFLERSAGEEPGKTAEKPQEPGKEEGKVSEAKQQPKAAPKAEAKEKAKKKAEEVELDLDKLDKMLKKN